MNYFLQHHGIKGQKWGVRNGPPYPLGSSQKTKSERNGDDVTRMLNKLDGCDPVTIAAYSTLAVAYIAAIVAERHAIRKAAEEYVKEFRKERMQELEERKKNRKVKKLSDLSRLSDKMEASESMKVTNPGFPDDEHVQNCTFCTAAMAMREKGYDVVAGPSKNSWYTDDLYEKVWGTKTTQMSPKQNREQMLQTLAQHGDGSYGHLGVTWKMGGGHSIFWKNEGGRVRIYDGQSGEEYSTAKNSWLMKAINFRDVDYCRLDNCEPTDYALAIVEPRSKGDNDGG